MTTLYVESWTQLKKEHNEVYKLVNRIAGYQHYRLNDNLKNNDMEPGHWFLSNNPNFVTPAQWQTICTRMLSYDTLKLKTLPEVIEGFYYEQRRLVVSTPEGNETFYIPSGNIMGWMQGMFMCISAEGNINT